MSQRGTHESKQNIHKYADIDQDKMIEDKFGHCCG